MNFPEVLLCFSLVSVIIFSKRTVNNFKEKGYENKRRKKGMFFCKGQNEKKRDYKKAGRSNYCNHCNHGCSTSSAGV